MFVLYWASLSLGLWGVAAFGLRLQGLGVSVFYGVQGLGSFRVEP